MKQRATSSLSHLPLPYTGGPNSMIRLSYVYAEMLKRGHQMINKGEILRPLTTRYINGSIVEHGNKREGGGTRNCAYILCQHFESIFGDAVNYKYFNNLGSNLIAMLVYHCSYIVGNPDQHHVDQIAHNTILEICIAKEQNGRPMVGY
jgi:hypothetical protein